jgi:hypothetical protein
MANVNLKKEDSTTNDNSQEQPAQEGMNTLDDDKAQSNTIQN